MLQECVSEGSKSGLVVYTVVIAGVAARGCCRVEARSQPSCSWRTAASHHHASGSGDLIPKHLATARGDGRGGKKGRQLRGRWQRSS